MTRKFGYLLGLAFALLVADQVTKQWVVARFQGLEGRGETVIPGLFDLIYTRNTGAAWGMLGDLKPDSLRIAVFVAISIAAVAMVVWMARRARPDQRLLLTSLGMVLGGALGNLVDRVVAGSVVDFLDFYTHAAWLGCGPQGCHWPAFNVADICITTGVGLLILESIVSSRDEARRAKEGAAGIGSGTGPAESGSDA